MSTAASATLPTAMRGLTHPRKRRGVRHPFSGLLSLTPLGLLCRRPDFLSIARRARGRWGQLGGPLRLTRDYAPHDTTPSRACARFSVEEFRRALLAWLAELADLPPALVAAVDGKASRQSRDRGGGPVHALNVFAHDLKVALARRRVGDGEEAEPEVLEARLAELFAAYPALRLLTGDAIFAQRPLAELIIGQGRHCLLAVKDNRPDLLGAARATLAEETPQTAGAAVREKKGAASSRAGSGSMPRRRRAPALR